MKIYWMKKNCLNTSKIYLNRVYMQQMETQLFASSYIWLAYILETSYSTVVTSVSKKPSADQSKLEK